MSSKKIEVDDDIVKVRAAVAAADNTESYKHIWDEAPTLGPLKELVTTTALCLGVESNTLVLPLLSAISAVTREADCIRVNGSFTENRSSMSVVVGSPGTGKSRVQKAVAKAVEAADDIYFMIQLEEEGSTEEEYEQERTGKAAGKRKLFTKHSTLTADVTAAGLRDMLASSTKPYLMLLDEMKLLFDKITTDQGESEMRTMLLTIWGGNAIRVMRSKLGRQIEIEGAVVITTGYTQPYWFAKMAFAESTYASRADGMAARFLTSVAQVCKFTLEDVEQAAADAAGSKLSLVGLFRCAPFIIGSAKEIQLSAEAKVALYSVVNEANRLGQAIGYEDMFSAGILLKRASHVLACAAGLALLRTCLSVVDALVSLQEGVELCDVGSMDFKAIKSLFESSSSLPLQIVTINPDEILVATKIVEASWRATAIFCGRDVNIERLSNLAARRGKRAVESFKKENEAVHVETLRQIVADARNGGAAEVTIADAPCWKFKPLYLLHRILKFLLQMKEAGKGLPWLQNEFTALTEGGIRAIWITSLNATGNNKWKPSRSHHGAPDHFKATNLGDLQDNLEQVPTMDGDYHSLVDVVREGRKVFLVFKRGEGPHGRNDVQSVCLRQLAMPVTQKPLLWRDLCDMTNAPEVRKTQGGTQEDPLEVSGSSPPPSGGSVSSISGTSSTSPSVVSLAGETDSMDLSSSNSSVVTPRKVAQQRALPGSAQGRRTAPKKARGGVRDSDGDTGEYFMTDGEDLDSLLAKTADPLPLRAGEWQNEPPTSASDASTQSIPTDSAQSSPADITFALQPNGLRRAMSLRSEGGR